MNKIPKVLVGIEFGTSKIRYAYASFNDKKIYESSFDGQFKVPAEIILNNNLKDVLAFGMECREFIANHLNQKFEYEYYKHIKINLYNRNYIIKSTNDREIIYNLLLQKYYRKNLKKPLNKFKKSIVLLLKEKI